MTTQRTNLGEELRTKKADDDSVVERAREAVANGDDSMLPILEWDARGRKPKAEGTKYHPIARRKVVRLANNGHTTEQICDKFNTYYALINRLKNADYRNVPNDKAKQIAEME